MFDKTYVGANISPRPRDPLGPPSGVLGRVMLSLSLIVPAGKRFPKPETVVSYLSNKDQRSGLHILGRCY